MKIHKSTIHLVLAIIVLFIVLIYLPSRFFANYVMNEIIEVDASASSADLQ